MMNTLIDAAPARPVSHDSRDAISQ